MSVYDSYQRRMRIDSHSTGRNYPTFGEKLKADSDFYMEQYWNHDVQSKLCYIYDYFHDDFFIDEHGIKRSLNEGMTYEHTNKTPINAKFIIKSYQSMDKDQVEYYLQFKPSQKTHFSKNDELYYFETDYRQKYGNENFISLYVDVPDDEGIYHKWMICRREIANQFPKYLILPCSYELMWIENTGKERIKRRMWSVPRQQLSYTIGTYTDRVYTRMDNQDKIWLPLNPITENLYYTNDESTNMRVIVSALTKHPAVWTITKVENTKPLGIQKLTIYQNAFNEHTDYVNYETGEMYADYYDNGIPALDQSISTFLPSVYSKISASTDSLKVGGSYKTLTLNIFKASDDDITKEYSDATFTWFCSIGDEDWTDKVTWRSAAYNQMKVKFPDDRSQLTKLITFKCTVIKGDISFDSEPLQLQLIV